MKVLACTRDLRESIAEIRVVRPLGDLAADGRIALRLRSFHELRFSDLHWPDVAVLQRALDPAMLPLIRRLRAAGVGVIYEIDDLLLDPAPHLAQCEMLRASATTVRTLMKSAHLVTVSTARLANALAAELGTEASSLHVVPNIGRPLVDARATHRADTPAVLLLASSDVLQLETLQAALARTLSSAQRELRLITVGPVADGLAALGLPQGRLQALPLMPHERFVSLLASLTNPVALMPLDDSAFSRCKSAVKYFDYALAGVPVVCVRRPPYVDVVKHGKTGWLVDDSAADWQQAIEFATTDLAARRRVADAARAAVLREHSPRQMEQAWLAALVRGGELGGPRRDLGASQRTLDALRDLLGMPARALRRANRARLERRARRWIDSPHSARATTTQPT